MFKKGKLPIKESYLLIIIIVGILSLSMYSSFALFSLEKTTSNDIVTMRAANNIETNINVYEYKTVTVDANSNLAVMVNVKNTTSDSIYYGVYYENAPVGVRVTKIDWSENNTTGNISGNTTLPVELMIINDTNSSVTINIGVAGGSSNELGLPDGKILVTEEFDTGAFYNTLPTMDDSDVEIKYDANNITYFKDLVTCTDNGSGCKIVLVRPSSTKDLTAGEHTVLYVLENNDGYRVKFNKKINLKSGTNAVELITKLNDNTSGDSGSGVYKVEHSSIAAGSSATGSDIPAVTDYRYYGASPNNYICLDMEGGSTCPDKHLYRIIGSIYEEKENTNRIKVIKATPLTDGTTKGFSWDYKVNNSRGSYDNIWATITSGNYSNSLTSGSQLMKLLNSGAWWNGTSGSYYNNSTTATNVNFTNYKLSDKAKSYITTSRYYLGGYNNSSGVMTNQFYAYERGTTRCDTNRPLYWDGMVGLMYPSDFGYAAGNTCVTGTDPYNYDGGCYQKDWLNDTSNNQWLMSPDSGGSHYAFGVRSSGCVDGRGVSITFAARPVFYLNSSASISEGEGTSAAPYILS